MNTLTTRRAAFTAATGTKEPIPAGVFFRWLSEQWATWRKLNNRSAYSRLTAEDHHAFDTWLRREYLK